MTLQATPTGKMMVWPSGRHMAACGCCAEPPPDCIHMAVFGGEDLLCEGDLLYVGNPNGLGLTWSLQQTSGDELWQDHKWYWNCTAGTVGYWNCDVGFVILPQNGGTWQRFGFSSEPGMSGVSYCSGVPIGSFSVFGYTIITSACETPGKASVARGQCSGCRGL